LGVLVAGAVVVLALFGIGGANKAGIERRKTHLAELQEELEKVRQSAKKVRELEAQQAAIAAKSQAIDEITSDRIVWSEQLHHLAKLMPDDIWLKDVEVVHKTRKVVVTVPGEDGGEPTTKEVPVPYISLKLLGYALSPEEEVGVELVGKLVDAIEKDTGNFGVHFKNPDPRLVKDQKFGDVNVKEFEVNCEIFAGQKKETANP
jgi:hypothetical protein